MTREHLFAFAKEYYGTIPDYPWDSTPDAAVLRNEFGKWYGLVMNLPRRTVGLKGEGKIDILNVKSDPMLISSLIGEKGYFPAYHMNKTYWISIALDGTVPNSEVENMLDLSYQLVLPKSKRKQNT